jgi:hypothetical protein
MARTICRNGAMLVSAALLACGGSPERESASPPAPSPVEQPANMQAQLPNEPLEPAAQTPAAAEPTPSAEAPVGMLPLDTAPEPPAAAPAAAVPAEPPRPTSTQGSGGPIGPAELTSMGGLTYRIDAPATPGPHGLLVLLHGSTASNYTNFIGLMRDVAQRYDLIPVSVLAPNGQGWNEGNQVRAAELLHRLVQEDLFPKYDIEEARVLFSGQSSGGGFLASNFVPAHAADYKGGAFLQCGAAPPNIAFTPNAATRQNFRLHFEITTGDPIWPDSYAAAIRAYTSAELQLTMDNTKPGGHCQFDQEQVILDHIDFVLAGAAGAAP